MFYSPLGCTQITFNNHIYHVSNACSDNLEFCYPNVFRVIKTPLTYTPSDYYDKYEQDIPTEVMDKILELTKPCQGLSPWINVAI